MENQTHQNMGNEMESRVQGLAQSGITCKRNKKAAHIGVTW